MYCFMLALLCWRVLAANASSWLSHQLLLSTQLPLKHHCAPVRLDSDTAPFNVVFFRRGMLAGRIVQSALALSVARFALMHGR